MSARRIIEWWAVLNCHKRPSDLPSGVTEDSAFAWCEKNTNRVDRLLFWNGKFNHGLNIESFIHP